MQKEKVRPRPTALNTVELMRLCSSGLGMGPQHAMSIAERLYTQGYISYPRTETTQYPVNFDIKGVLLEHKSSPIWGAHVASLLSGDIVHPKSGKDVGDHPPITPTRLASESAVGGGDAWRVYDLITRVFIASVSPDCRYIQTTIAVEIAGEHFATVGQRMIDAGFTAVLHWLAKDEQSVPELKSGQELIVIKASLERRQTSPPGYLTESELISLMEKHGIGTDASIPVHINNICEVS